MIRSFLALGFVAALLLISNRCLALALHAELFIDAAPSETTFMVAPTGDANHIYLGGRFTSDVWIHDRSTGQLLGTFLNLPNASQFAQDGLLSMAFHPDYANNGKFYTYTFSNNDLNVRITEHKRSTTNPLIADPSYQRQILAIPSSGSHNGGWIGFSPIDGNLYVTTGDNGVIFGPNNGLPAQDPFDLHGKVLRLDVDGDAFPADPDKNYEIPVTNPFATSGGAPEVFALGLRHPFRSGFDSQTGDLYIGDVGSVYFEEINFLPAGTNGGQNFGWRAKEGSIDQPDWNDPAPPGAIDPIYEYATRPGGASVIGGVVYRGSDIPELQGTYFFGDYVRDEVHSFEYDGSTLTNYVDRTYQMFANDPATPIAFAEDGLGELYLVDIINSDLYRIVEAPEIAGDYNEDGRIGPDDFTTWRDNFGAPAGTLPNDVDGGTIGMDQYNTWVASYTSYLASSPSTTIPEPTAWWLLMCAGATLTTIARRR